MSYQSIHRPFKRGVFKERVGFTIVEMSVVIAILLILSALVVPSVIAYQKSRVQEDLEAAIARLPLEAKNQSAKDQVPVSLRIDGTQLVMEETPAGGEIKTVKQLDLGTQMVVQVVQLNGKSSDTGSWLWTAYPDGVTDKGGIQFAYNGEQKSLVFGAGGGTTWVNGDLPDQSLDQWPAGALLQRS